jgi:hypothetical protein
MRRLAIAGLCLALLTACRDTTPAPAPPPPEAAPETPPAPSSASSPQVTPAPAAVAEGAEIVPVDFVPIARAARAVRRARKSGLTEKQFDALLQPFRQAVAAARAHPLDADDAARLDRYQQALDAYEFSIDVWQASVQRQTSAYGGDRPVVQIGTMTLDRLMAGARRYGLPLSDEVMRNDPSVTLKVLPADSLERMWATADALVTAATSTGPSQAPR